MTIKAKGKPTVKDYNKLVEDFESLNERVEKAEAKAKEWEDKAKNGIAGFPNVHTSQVGGDEQKALSYFGAGHVKQLLDVNTQDQKFSYVPDNIKGMVYQLKSDFQTARAIAQMFYGDPWDHIGASEDQERFANCKSIGESYFFKNVLAPKLKAFGTGVVGGGAEWIPTAIASQYISEYELSREIVGMLKQINMPTSPYEIPTAGKTVARRATENVTATDSSFTTGALQFSAKKYLEYYIFPEELREDSAADIVALGRAELTEAHLRGFETSLINGVQSGTAHIDSDTQVGAADLAEKQFHGLRYLAIQNTANGATVDFGNAVASDALLGQMRAAMGKFGVDPSKLVWLPGSTAYLQMLKTQNVVTVDKLGPNATVLKGQLGSYDGIPIVQTGFMRNDLNATGVYDGVTVDRTGMLLVHRDRLYWGTRRPIRMAIRPSKSADDRIEMASYSRVDFKAHPQGAAEDELTIVYGLNQAT
jgi:hypothetical protein